MEGLRGMELVGHFRRGVANMWMSDPVEDISEAKYVQMYWNLATALGEIEQARIVCTCFLPARGVLTVILR